MSSIVLSIAYLFVAIILITFILLQQGKGAEMGASFGAGASGTVFGSAGSANFLTRTTAVLAIIFFALSIIIGNVSSHLDGKPTGKFDDLSGVAEQTQHEVQPVDVPKPNSDIPQ